MGAGNAVPFVYIYIYHTPLVNQLHFPVSSGSSNGLYCLRRWASSGATWALSHQRVARPLSCGAAQTPRSSSARGVPGALGDNPYFIGCNGYIEIYMVPPWNTQVFGKMSISGQKLEYSRGIYIYIYILYIYIHIHIYIYIYP